jgi:cell division protein FtsN
LKRLTLLVVLSLMALPLWADYGLSNVVTKQIDRGMQGEQPPAAKGSLSLPEPVKPGEPAPAEMAPPQAPPQFKKTAFYPYTIHISSWQTKKDALAQYKQKYRKLDGVFITKIDLGENGTWYRIDAGAFASVNEAVARMKDLQEKGVIDTEAFIGSSVPLAIELKVLPDREQARKTVEKLRGDGVLAYIMKESDSVYRVLTGAFPDRKSGVPALDELSAMGLQAKITKR